MANKVDILIKAKDQASAEINKITGSLNDMGNDGSQASDGLGDSFDDMVGAITTAAAIAAAAITVFKEALEFSKEGAGIKRLQDTSAMLASSIGLDMDEIVAKVSAASLNTVSDLDIMSSAAKAMMLGVGGSADELASLMEVAAIRGRALGMDATEAFDQIVRGIGRLSPKILDNLGIIIDADAAYDAYAEGVGKTADELTEMEKRQALVNAVIADTAPLLAESGGLAEDSAAAWEQMSAAQKNFWDNLKADAADLMSWWPQFWTDFYDNMNASRDIPELRQQLNDLMQSLLDLKQVTPEEYQSVMNLAYAHRAAGETVKVLNELLDMYGETANGATNKTNKLSTAYGNLTDDTQEWADANYEGEAAAIAAAKATENMALAAEEAALAQEKLDTAMYKAIANLGERYTPLLKDIAENEADIVELQTIIEQGGGMFDGQWMSAKSAKEEIAKLTIEIENARLAMEGLAAQAVAGIAWGQITADAKVSLEEITRYYDFLVAAGIMSADAGEQAIKDFMEYWGLWDPEAKPLPVETTLDSSETDDYEPPSKKQLVEAELDTSDVDVYQPGTRTLWVETRLLNNAMDRASGGIVNAASGLAASLPYYWVGERGPEPFFPSVDGRIVSNTQAMSALRGGAGANASDIANAVKQGVKEAMRDTGGGKTFNLTMPTSSNPADVRTAFELMEAWA